MTLDELNQPAQFIARARSRLLSAPEPPRKPGDPVLGDHRLPGFDPDPERLANAVSAAVLVPVTFGADGGQLILTERSAMLRAHSGQVAFPGGRVDPGETVLQAAMREAEEEIALQASAITPLGFLPDYYTGTGYRITPTVALIDTDAQMCPNPAEVERVFGVPFATVFNMDRYRLESGEWQGRARRFYVVDHADAYIWGATAAITRILYERLTAT